MTAPIKSKLPTPEYKENWDKIFGLTKEQIKVIEDAGGTCKVSDLNLTDEQLNNLTRNLS